MSNKPVIVIDPGHGGSSKVGGSSPNNAVGPNGLLEKNLTLDMANRVAATLADRADVFLTRAGDRNLGLSERAKFAREKNAAVFLSIHFNGFSDTNVDGTEVWVAKQATPGSRALAKNVLNKVVGATQIKDRGVREGDLGVILPARHAANTSACLLEVSFLSNPAQARRLTEESYKRQLAEAIVAGVSDYLGTGVAAQQGLDEYSQPFFDAGEHVLAGGDLYADRLLVGKNPGVAFSYGQIIAMGDLYETVDDMMEAGVSELQKIKSLLVRNTKYYETNKKDDKLDVSHTEWDTATADRYFKLAENNFEHFSPYLFYKDTVFGKTPSEHGNNRTAWEHYHERAIKEAQKIALDPKNRNRTTFLEYPLIVNAFGDHFLTDAFSSGHIVNKEELIRLFRHNFFKGDELKPEGEGFFAVVAKLAFKGDVKKKFSKLETVGYPACKWGWCLKAHINIDTENMFRKLLIQIANERPAAVGNIAAKALHDWLNENGIEVTNAAGHKPWKLMGDTFLDATNVKMMQAAVQQSVDNINDPSINASNLNFGAYFAKVWKYVPQLTEASQKSVKRLMQEYADPKSNLLISAAARLITKQVDSIIKMLKKEKALKDV